VTTIHSLWLSPYQLITLGLALIGVGLTMLWSARPRSAHLPGRAIRQGRRWSRPLACTLVSAALITGAQWAVMSWSDARVVWVVALGLPALLVGAAVARLLAIAQHVRTVCRGPRDEFCTRPARGRRR
jgi:cell division protein FtsW (lipid II flippase)